MKLPGSKVDPEHHALPTISNLASKRAASRSRLVCYFPCCIPLDERTVSRNQRGDIGRGRSANLQVLPSDGNRFDLSQVGDISGAILQQLDIKQWTSFQCCRYGIRREPPRNPVTVLVTVCCSAEGWFLSSQGKIQAILASFGETTTAVVFLQDELKS